MEKSELWEVIGEFAEEVEEIQVEAVEEELTKGLILEWYTPGSVCI